MKKTIIAALAAISISTASAQLSVSTTDGALACRNLTQLEAVLALMVDGDFGYVKKAVTQLTGDGDCVIVDKGVPFYTTKVKNKYFTVIYFGGGKKEYWIRSNFIKLINKKSK